MGVDGISGQRGSDHIDAVELSFVVDSLLISPQQVAIGDGDVEGFSTAAVGFASEPLNRSRLAEFDLWRRAVAAISVMVSVRAAAVRVFAPALGEGAD